MTQAKHNDRLCVENPVDKINAFLAAQGARFVDVDFPPVERSVNWDNKRESSVHFDTFKRLQDLVGGAHPHPEVFVDGVDPDDVIQGRLGNCWFVQCLAGVATRKRAIEAMIYPGTYNPAGVRIR